MDLWVVMQLIKLGVQLCNDQDSIALYCYKSFIFASILTDAFLTDFWNSLQFLSLTLGEYRYPQAHVIRRILCTNSGYRWSHNVMLDNLYWFSIPSWRDPRSTVSGIYFTHSYADVIRHQAISHQRYIASEFWVSHATQHYSACGPNSDISFSPCSRSC